jgi:hypothetical protein
MGRLEPIDGKITSWEGLWWHPEYNGFSSAVISLANLKKFKGKVRLYMRKNKYFNGGENGRPNYNFCLRDADADIFNTLTVEDDRYDGERLYTEEEVRTIVNGVIAAMERGVYDPHYNPSDYI